ncbi:MAG TPA: DoxX family membrane protein [Candidatus Acidoferrum sp.]
MPVPIVLWPCLAGAAFLVAGLFAAKRELQAASGIDKWIVLGSVFVAAPLAVFGAEHLAAPRIIMVAVPPWMPARLFWTYFVGMALIAAALSLTVKKFVRLSTALLAAMFFLFVLIIHVPNVVARVHERLFWSIACRDTVFGAGPLALAGALMAGTGARRLNWMVQIGRLLIGAILIFFGVQECLYPKFAPGVPLPKVTPAWVPVPAVWGYLAGAMLVVCGVCILVNKYARVAATCVGILMAVLTLFLYAPILAMASGIPQIVEGLNYVADTLLFGGAVLLLARALPKEPYAKSAH